MRFFILSALLTSILSLGSSCHTATNSKTELVFPGHDWKLSAPEEQGLNRESAQKALGYLRAQLGIDALDKTMIIKNGYVVFAGDSLNNRQSIYGCTKGLTTTAAGLLFDDGVVTMGENVADIEPLLQPYYPELKLRQLATMTSGYAAVGDNRWGQTGADWSITPYQPAPPFFKPGAAFAYWDEAYMMYSRVLTKLANRDLYDLLHQRIMSPLGISNWTWVVEDSLQLADGSHVPIRNGASGIELSASDFARIGWLYANKGVWAGDTLLSSAFAEASMRNQVEEPLPVVKSEQTGMAGPGVFGFGWWVGNPNATSENRLINAPDDTAYLTGFNENFCIVIPSEKLVIVRMGEDGEPTTLEKHIVYNEVIKLLLSKPENN